MTRSAGASACNAGDVDLDGWQDFFVTNGFNDSSGPNALFRNLGDRLIYRYH